MHTHTSTLLQRMWHRKTNPFIQYRLMLLLPKQPWCIFLFLTLSCRQSCNCFLNQDLRVPQFRLHCWRCLEHRGWGKVADALCMVRVCVFCVNSYCKWDLKNWHSHLSSAPHLSQTNEGPEPQSEIDISFWTSRGNILNMERGSSVPGDPKGASSLLFFPHLHSNNNLKK